MIRISYDGNCYITSNLYFMNYYITIWMTQSIKIDVMHRKRKSRCLQRPSLWLCFPFLSSLYKVNIDRIDWFFDHLIDIFDTLETQNLILSLFFHFQYNISQYILYHYTIKREHHPVLPEKKVQSTHSGLVIILVWYHPISRSFSLLIKLESFYSHFFKLEERSCNIRQLD